MRFAALAWVAVAFIGTTTPASAGKGDDTLNVAFAAEPSTMDAYKESTREGLILSRLLYDCLIYKNPKTGKFEPELASSFNVENDSTIFLQIRDDVRFHDGSRMTADDVVYTLNLVSSKEYKPRYHISVDWIERVEKVGDNGVRIHSKRPSPLALEMLAGNLPIYPKAYYTSVGSGGMGIKPIGTGPYRLVEMTPGTRFVLERFDGYYAQSPKGQPAIKRIVARVLPEANTQYAELMNGQLDWIWRIPPNDVRNLARNPKLQVQSVQILRYAYIEINPKFDDGKSPLADVRVRRALNYAINRAAIAKAFVGGASRVINAACSPDQFGCTDDVAKYPFDPAKAKQLLAEAGYPNGFSTTIMVTGIPSQQAEAIAANLASVGVTVKLDSQQYASAASAWRAGQVPLLMGNWGSWGVADVGLSVSHFFSGTADDITKDPKVIEPLQQADTSMDRTLRAAKYAEALQRVADQAYWIPLWTYSVNTASNVDLDFTLDHDEYARFFNAKWK